LDLPSASSTSASDVPAPSGPPLLRVRGLRKTYRAGGLFGRGQSTKAVDDVSFELRRGESVALVGQSGSGKSSLARLLVRLERPDAGEIWLDGVEVLRQSRRVPLAFRARVQMVFQDPFASLNPANSVFHHLARPLLRHHRAARRELRARATELLETVGLGPAAELLDKHPFELSGGQRQRVAIARALAVEPTLLIADEPTSMLDVSSRGGIMRLLSQLQHGRGLALLLITHDLVMARAMAERLLVLYQGQVVEEGRSATVLTSPANPYTRSLLAAIATDQSLRDSIPRASPQLQAKEPPRS